MANNIDKDLQQSFEQTIQTNRTANREMSSAVKNVIKFSDALEEASNTAIDKAVASLKDLLVKTDLLTDAQADSIKNAKQATTTLAALAKRQARLTEMLDDYNHQMKEVIKRGKTQKAQDEDIAKINERYVSQLHKLGIHTTDQSDITQAINGQLAKHLKIQKGVTDQTEEVSKIHSKLGKVMVNNTESWVDNTKNMVKWGMIAKQARKAVQELYSSAVDLSNKGMLMSMRAQMEGAIRLRLTMDEFQKLVSENMDMIASLGGGVGGIDRFTEELKFASQGLEHLGKNAAAYGMKNAKVLMKAGLGPNSKNGLDVTYRSNLLAMNKQFTLFQAGFGDTIEEFSGYYDAILQGEDVQSKLNTMSATATSRMLTEIRVRTENARVLGMTNDGLKSMAQNMNAMFNPRKNNQAERMKQSAYANMAFSSLQSSLSPEDQQQLQGLMPLFQQINQLKLSGDTQGAQNLLLSKGGQRLSELLQRANSAQIQASVKRGDAGVGLYASNAMLEGADMYMNDYLNIGQASLEKGRSGQANRIGSPEVALWMDQTKKMADESGTLTKAFNLLRTAVEQYQSIVSNPLGLLAGMIVVNQLIGGVGGALKGLIAAVSKGGSLFGLAARGVMTGVLTIIKKIPMLGALFAEIKGFYDGFNTDTSDYNTRFGIDQQATVVPQFMKDLGVRTLGVGSDILSAAGQTISFGAWNPSNSFADKQLKTSSANEAIMLKALSDNGITDPKQQAILMGQLSHESGGFKQMTELGSGSRYEGRKDLGNTQAGDGEKYKGRGFIQLTGRDNYKRAGDALGYDLINNPDLAADPNIAAKIAAWYVSTKKVGGESIVSMAGRGDIMGVTTAINGGTNGLQQRLASTSNYMSQLFGAGGGAPSTGVTGVLDSDGLPAVSAAIPSVAAGSPSDPLTELQKQTSILMAIATNTMPSKGVDPRVYKRPQDVALAGS